MATQSIVADEKVGHEHDASSKELSDSGSGHAPAETLVAKDPKRTWRSYLWDTFDKSPEERRFLFKLDAVILTFASLGYFIKYLDQVNVNNAYVSGMKEDMGFYGNELNYMVTCWTVGYVIGEIPR
jgi:ACS family pantothenate transporter-like MFS transporter